MLRTTLQSLNVWLFFVPLYEQINRKPKKKFEQKETKEI